MQINKKAPTGEYGRHSNSKAYTTKNICQNQKFTDFEKLKHKIQPHVLALLRRGLPGGKLILNQYIALNPTRHDKHLGSFKINIHTGQWCDWATGDKGGDIISLWAYLHGLTQMNALKEIQLIIGGANV